jgi:hypothetical protein
MYVTEVLWETTITNDDGSLFESISDVVMTGACHIVLYRNTCHFFLQL